jgi:hypothetical protein
MPLTENKAICPQCGKDVKPGAKFCTISCAAKDKRLNQLMWEQQIADSLAESGWQIISPTACCDRIGIRDGRVYFLEFKKEGETTLRTFQAAVRDLVPGMYRIIAGTKNGDVASPILAQRAKRKRQAKRSGVSSRFIGVSWSAQRQKWRAASFFNGKKVHHGYFDLEEAAGLAVADAEHFYFTN